MKCLKPEEVFVFMEEYQKLSAIYLHVPLRDTWLFLVSALWGYPGEQLSTCL